VLWILLDVAIAVAALVVLAVLVLGLWRKVKALSATVAAAGERLGEASDRLAAVQAEADHAPDGRRPVV
jgi:hypothetical protein